MSQRGKPPEVEDCLFDPTESSADEKMQAPNFWSLLRDVAQHGLEELFGSALERQSSTFAVAVDTGNASLGCLIPPKSLKLEVNAYDKVRLSMGAGQDTVNLPVTDLRFYEHDHKTPRRNKVQELNRRIRAGVGTILSVGLTRRWLKPGDSTPKHWLQVNNIHLEDDPNWPVS